MQSSFNESCVSSSASSTDASVSDVPDPSVAQKRTSQGLQLLRWWGRFHRSIAKSLSRHIDNLQGVSHLTPQFVDLIHTETTHEMQKIKLLTQHHLSVYETKIRDYILYIIDWAGVSDESYANIANSFSPVEVARITSTFPAEVLDPAIKAVTTKPPVSSDPKVFVSELCSDLQCIHDTHLNMANKFESECESIETCVDSKDITAKDMSNLIRVGRYMFTYSKVNSVFSLKSRVNVKHLLDNFFKP